MDPLFLWGVGLLASALLVLVVELFLPSAGTLLLVAGVLAVSGVVCLYRYDTMWGIIGTLLVIVGGPIIGFFGLQIMPNTPVGRRLILRDPEREGDGDDDEDRPPPQPSSTDVLRQLVGTEGEVVSDLRPIGVVKVEGKRYDAISDSGMVRAGQRIRVTGAEGTELRVRAVG